MAPDPRANTSDGFALRLAGFYAGLFVVFGVHMPLFPVWLAARGLDAAAVGIVLAIPMAVRLVSVPLAARAADRSGALRGALIATSLAAFVGYGAIGLSQSFWAICLAVATAAAVFAPMMPLADAYALKGLAQRGRAYGPVRVYGSVAFIAANLVAGLLFDRMAPGHLIWLIVGALAGAAAASLLLRPLQTGGPVEPPQEPKAHRLHSPKFLAVAVAAALIQASHAVFYGFSTLDWSRKGLDGVAIGALWALGVVAEIGLFASSGRWVRRIDPLALMGIGAASAALRWFAMALDPAALWLPVLQLLHGLSFGATHLGSLQFLAHAAPERRSATAQGDFSTILAAVMAGAMSVSGLAYAAYGAGAYGVMAVVAVAGGLLLLIAGRLRML